MSVVFFLSYLHASLKLQSAPLSSPAPLCSASGSFSQQEINMHQLSIVPFSVLEYAHKKKNTISQEKLTAKINSTAPLHSET